MNIDAHCTSMSKLQTTAAVGHVCGSIITPCIGHNCNVVIPVQPSPRHQTYPVRAEMDKLGRIRKMIMMVAPPARMIRRTTVTYLPIPSPSHPLFVLILRISEFCEMLNVEEQYKFSISVPATNPSMN